MLRDGLYLRGKTWWISFALNGRRIRESAETSNKKLAEAILSKKRLLIAENRYLDVRRESGVKFRDFSAEYLERYSKPNKRSWKSSDSNSIKKLNRFFGDLELSKITQQMVEEYVRLRRATKKRRQDGKESYLAPATVNRELSCLKTMFTKAMEWDQVESSPCVKVWKLKENNARTRFLTDEEIERLMKAALLPKLRQVITVFINTGMRKGELQNLKWLDLDFDRNLITLPRTKNGKVHYIPMNEVTKQVLLQRRIAKESPLLVFSGTKANRPWDFVTAFRLARKRANLTDVRIHDLRHTFASHLCMKGVDIMTVKELLGHSSLEMTQRYSHLTDRHKAEAVARLEGLVTIRSQSGDQDEAKEFETIVSSLKSICPSRDIGNSLYRTHG